jgi:hypothetical protein
MKLSRRNRFPKSDLQYSRRNGFAQKVDPIWTESVCTGSAGARARPNVRSTLNLKPPDGATVSRFALIAGEGARAPSIKLSHSAHTTFWARPDERQLTLTKSGDIERPIKQRSKDH